MWIAFDARLEQTQTANQFAGLSMFNGGSEEFFLGAPNDLTDWGSTILPNPSVGTTSVSGAEWARLMAHIDYGSGNLDLYVNGELQASDTTLPLRGWDGVRLADGTLLPPINELSVDRLRIGTSRFAVEPPERARFATNNFADNTIRLLDGNRNEIDGFPAGNPSVNAVTSDGYVVYSASFAANEIVLHDLNGVELNRFPVPASGVERGLTMVGRELALQLSSGIVEFRDPATGNVLRTITTSCTSGAVEGMTYEEGQGLWVLCGTTIELFDAFASGPAITTIPNPASGICAFNGSGLTSSAPGELTVACTNGNWYRISSVDGSIIQVDNNGLDMWGFGYVPEPGFGSLLGIGALGLGLVGGARSRRRRGDA